MKNRIVAGIRNDNLSGAFQLTGNTMHVLVTLLNERQYKSSKILIKEFQRTCTRLADAQPFMASIRNGMASAADFAEHLKKDNLSTEAAKSKIVYYLKKQNKYSKSAVECLGEIGREIIDPNIRILTYSSSGSVARVLLSARKKGIPFSVILSEARPMNEGILFAKQLSKYSIPVSLVIDIHLSHYIPSAHRVIIGADWISETQFTNKVGTGLIVDLALTQNIPVYVASTTDKILAQSFYPLETDSHPPEEILRTRSKYILVKNRYFESVPLRNGIRFITEKGILEQEEIIKLAKTTQNLPKMTNLNHK